MTSKITVAMYIQISESCIRQDANLYSVALEQDHAYREGGLGADQRGAAKEKIGEETPNLPTKYSQFADEMGDSWVCLSKMIQSDQIFC